MFKVVFLLKRKEGLSMKEFISYYEDTHAKLGLKYLSGGAVRYIRRYLHPISDLVTENRDDADYDVVTETWYVDRAAFDNTLARYTPEVREIMAACESNFLDKSRRGIFFVEEHETPLSSTFTE